MTAFAAGLGLGVFTGLPLGVINIAIVDAATSSRPRFALGLAIGGALADATHAALAFLGLAGLVTAQPSIVRVLAIVTVAVVGGYAVVTWRARRPTTIVQVEDRGTGRGVATGLGLTLPNPAALGAWVAVAATWPAGSAIAAGAVALGVGFGSAMWFAFLGRWVGRVRRDHPVVRVVPRVAAVAFVVFVLVGLVRAAGLR